MNKFRGLQPLPDFENPLVPGQMIRFIDGFRGDVDSDFAPLDSARDLLDLRWIRDGITADWGRKRFFAGTNPIRAIGHYVTVSDVYRFFRMDYESATTEVVIRVYNFFLDSWTESARLNTGFDPLFPVSVLSTQLSGSSTLFANASVGILDWDTVAGTLTVVADAPKASDIIQFEDRIVAAGDFGGGGRSALSWTNDGIYDDWVGGDSGQIVLIDSTLAVVDPIHRLLPVGDNVLAALRAHSIYRVFETGNFLQAVGAVPWIEGLGVLARGTAQAVPGGIIFLGSDYNVHFLSTGGHERIGDPLKLRLKEFSGVEQSVAAYSPHAGEYILSIVEGAVPIESWVIDIDDAQKGKGRWRKASIEAVLVVPSLDGTEGFSFVDIDEDIYRTSSLYNDIEGVQFEGYWISHPLFKDDPGFEYELAGIALRYESLEDTKIDIDVSRNGDSTWDESVEVQLASTAGKVAQTVNVWFYATGPRTTLRFKIASDGGLSGLGTPPVLISYMPLFRRGKSVFRR